MKKLSFAVLLFAATLNWSLDARAQRTMDRLDRGLIAMKAGTGIYLNWRILGEEYYDVSYNVYRDGRREDHGRGNA